MVLFRFAIFTLVACSIGCSSTKNEPQSPPPGFAPAMGYTPQMVTPPSSGCSSCGASSPVVNAPRYTPPMTASPAIPQTLKQAAPATGLALGTPVSAAPVMGPLQVAFKPSIAPIETAKLGMVEVDETTSIPVPPVE
jgi:hypothetical protein